jgi:hypothetical protein
VSVATIKLLLTIGIQALRLARWYYSNLSPDERKGLDETLTAWKKQIKDMPMMDELDPNHGMGGQ